jgi:hypothetical protein
VNTRFRWLNGIVAAALLAGFAASAEETAPLESDSLQTPRQEISAELSASIRDSLHGITPEIALPIIDVQPPTPVATGS